jgi:hypothetical protein
LDMSVLNVMDWGCAAETHFRRDNRPKVQTLGTM